MIATRLQLELLLQEPSISLNDISEVILSDVGATLQILRLIGEEYTDREDRPVRIEDCIASLTLERCFQVVCGSTIPHESDVLSQWLYFRRVAQFARELAGCVDGISPEQAYLVGLLHGVGKVPHLLGWKESGDSSSEQQAIGVMLADYWHLPAYLLNAIREQHEGVDRPLWSEILQIAEQAAGSFYGVAAVSAFPVLSK